MRDDVERYRRWRRRITGVGCVLLALDALLLSMIASCVIRERSAGTWSMIGGSIVMSLFQYPLAIVGILVGIVLVIERGGGRFIVGIPLLALSIMLLRYDVPILFGKYLARLLGYPD